MKKSVLSLLVIFMGTAAFQSKAAELLTAPPVRQVVTTSVPKGFHIMSKEERNRKAVVHASQQDLEMIGIKNNLHLLIHESYIQKIKAQENFKLVQSLLIQDHLQTGYSLV